MLALLGQEAGLGEVAERAGGPEVDYPETVPELMAAARIQLGKGEAEPALATIQKVLVQSAHTTDRSL